MLTQLYILAALYVLLPVAALVLLRLRHKFRLTSVIGGVAGFFLAMRILMTVLNMLLTALGVTTEFWESHETLNRILNILVNALFQNLSLYLILKYVLKSRMSLYDGMAMGISFCLGNCFIQGYYFVYASRLYQSYQAGTLANLASEALPLESLQATVDEIIGVGLFHYYFQVLNAAVIIFLSMVLGMLLYHGLKKPDQRFLPLALGLQILALGLVEIGVSLPWIGFYPLADLLVAGITCFIFLKYMTWYRQQQRDLAAKKKAYRESLKTTS